MPNYLYKCNNWKCNSISELTLPISTHPGQLFTCGCGHKKSRIMRPWGAVKGFKTFAGNWFKKTYGHDIGAAAEDKAQQKEDWDTLKRETDRDNANSN